MPGRPGKPSRRPEDRRTDRKGRDSRSWERDGGRDAARDDGPRRPIKGKRRTFDIDSAPNDREHDRRSDQSDEGRATDDRGRDEWIDEGPVRKAAGDAVRRGGAQSRSGSGTQGSGKQGSGKQGSGKQGSGKQGSGKQVSGKHGSGKHGSGGGKSTRPAGGRNAKRKRARTSKRVEDALEIDRDRLVRTLGATKATRALGQLADATEAFGEDRLEDARKLLKPLAELIPDEPAIRELNGLALYRLGRWRLAVTELTEFNRRTGSTDQHPVLADCHRALGQHPTVERLWTELAEASPDAATVAEGRIVYAGSLADQGKLADAIKVLESGSLGSKTLKDHHLRMRYALADLYDRAGEGQAARRHFEAVVSADPDFFDAADRLRQL